MSAWQKRDIPTNCFLLPHEVFELGLVRGALVVYIYLVHHKYLRHGAGELSCTAIGKAVGLCSKTVRVHLSTLAANGLIHMDSDGGKFSYTLSPIQDKMQKPSSMCKGGLSA